MEVIVTEVLKCIGKENHDKISIAKLKLLLDLPHLEVDKIYTFLQANKDVNGAEDDFCVAFPSDRTPIQYLINLECFPKEPLTEDDVENLKIGDFVIARWNDFCFYRARIEAKWLPVGSKRMSYKVRYVDYGNLNDFALYANSLFRYQACLETIPIQALRIQFLDHTGKREKKLWRKVCALGDFDCRIVKLQFDNVDRQAVVMHIERIPVIQPLEDTEDTVIESKSMKASISKVSKWLASTCGQQLQDTGPPEEYEVVAGETDQENVDDVTSVDRRRLSETFSCAGIESLPASLKLCIVGSDSDDFPMYTKQMSETGSDTEFSHKASADPKCQEDSSIEELNVEGGAQISEEVALDKDVDDGNGNVECDEISEEQQIVVEKEQGQMSTISQERNIVDLDLCLPNELSFSAELTEYKSPHLFYAIDVKHVQVRNDIEKCIGDAAASLKLVQGSPEKFVSGSCWALNYKQLGWCRVQVQEVPDRPTMSVPLRLMDYGNDGVCAQAADLYWLPYGLPSNTGQLALNCSVIYDQEFSQEAVEYFYHALSNNSFLVEIDSFDGEQDVFSVRICFQDNTEILDWMAMKSFVTTESIYGPYNGCDQNTSFDSDDDELVGGGSESSVDKDGDDTSKCDTDEGISMQWNPMVEEYLDRRNNLLDVTTDPELAISGRTEKDDLCQKFLLYKSCPKGEFCDKVHRDLDDIHSAGGNIASHPFNNQLPTMFKRKSAIKLKSVTLTPPHNLTVVMETVSVFSNEFTVEDIGEMIDETVNKRFDRSVTFNHDVVGLKLAEYGWVRALILGEVEGEKCVDTYEVRLIDYGKEMTCCPHPSDLKQLVTGVREIPALSFDCFSDLWHLHDCETRVKEFLSEGGPFSYEVVNEIQDKLVIRLYRSDGGNLIPLLTPESPASSN